MDEEWKEGSYQYPLEHYLLEAIELWASDRNSSWANELGAESIVEKFDELWDSIGLPEESLQKQEIFNLIEQFEQRIWESSQALVIQVS